MAFDPHAKMKGNEMKIAAKMLRCHLRDPDLSLEEIAQYHGESPSEMVEVVKFNMNMFPKLYNAQDRAILQEWAESVLDFSRVKMRNPILMVGNPKSLKKQRCKGYTNGGKRCKRKVRNIHGYCADH